MRDGTDQPNTLNTLTKTHTVYFRDALWPNEARVQRLKIVYLSAAMESKIVAEPIGHQRASIFILGKAFR